MQGSKAPTTVAPFVGLNTNVSQVKEVIGEFFYFCCYFIRKDINTCNDHYSLIIQLDDTPTWVYPKPSGLLVEGKPLPLSGINVRSKIVRSIQYV